MFCDFKEVECFVQQFEALTLPKTSWTHTAHFVVGLWYLSHHPLPDAIERIRKGIFRYNEAVGTINSDTSGYHETLTLFYIHHISVFLGKHPTPKNFLEVLQELLKSKLLDKDFPLNYYSKARIMYVEARRKWIEPDLRRLDEPIAGL